MKKLVLTAVMMMMPFTALALDAMNDSALDEMTAQEGVTITFDNVVITQTAADMAWSDSDGDGVGTTGGTVYLAQGGSTVTTITDSLTIDVATADGDVVVGTETIGTGTTFVKIGLPSVSQAASAKTMEISLGADVAAAAGGAQTLGTLYQDSGSSSISGAVYIYAH
ncbi:hypothetical protein JCM14469_16400 [Desulfatiferula olefinivorans]